MISDFTQTHSLHHVEVCVLFVAFKARLHIFLKNCKYSFWKHPSGRSTPVGFDLRCGKCRRFGGCMFVEWCVC